MDDFEIDLEPRPGSPLPCGWTPEPPRMPRRAALLAWVLAVVAGFFAWWGLLKLGLWLLYLPRERLEMVLVQAVGGVLAVLGTVLIGYALVRMEREDRARRRRDRARRAA